MRMPSPYCKLPVACLMALALLISLSHVAHAEKKSEASPQSLSLVQEKLAKLKQALNQSQEARKDAADALKDSEVAISVANKKLYEINQKQQAHKAMLAKLAAESLATNQALTSQQKQLSKQLYQQYLHGRQSYVQMVLQNDHPSAMAPISALVRSLASASTGVMLIFFCIASHIDAQDIQKARVTSFVKSLVVTEGPRRLLGVLFRSNLGSRAGESSQNHAQYSFHVSYRAGILRALIPNALSLDAVGTRPSCRGRWGNAGGQPHGSPLMS